MIGRIVTAFCASVLLIIASASQAESPQEEKLLLDKAYPIRSDENVIIARYRENQPITIYLPDTGPGKVPVVIFNHGRPFFAVNSGIYRLWPSHELVANLNAAGIAVALPVRTGYFSTPGPTLEGGPCDNLKMSDFERVAVASESDVVAAVNYVRTLPMIDADRIYVGGSSTGGFATAVSLDKLEGKIAGAFTFNAGRCGERGEFFNGIELAESLFKDAAAASTMPVVFFASENDTAVPPASTRRLKDAVCAARGLNCSSTVFLITLPGVGHELRGTSLKAFPYVISLVRNGRP